MTFEPVHQQAFIAALRAAGLISAGEFYSVALAHQTVTAATLSAIAEFVGAFDRVTAREAWTTAVTRDAPAVARAKRSEACFFSAFDFHLPCEGGFQMIEFNDNGSGLLFAGIVNAVYYETAGLGRDPSLRSPIAIAELSRRVGEFIDTEAASFFGAAPEGLYLILDDVESLRAGRFRGELDLLRDLLGERGRPAEVGAPDATSWDGGRLRFDGRTVAFVVNRSTDFFWEGKAFEALRNAYGAGAVYVAPNPFSYATRSDKRLLELLSTPERDDELGIGPDERRILSAHVPETRVLSSDNVDRLARDKSEWVFKPAQGYGGRGLIDREAVGAGRLRRLVRQGLGYVAQKRIGKRRLETDDGPLWADLRVWVHRGAPYLVSGRASTRPDRLDLAAPGGWLPTYVRP